jgi:outer membrane cobalamin receptor
MTSYGSKFDSFVQQAKDLGLDVHVEAREDGVMVSASATIVRPRVTAENALDVYRNSQVVYLHAVRCFGRGKWSNSARYSSAGSRTLTELSLRSVPYRLGSLTD